MLNTQNCRYHAINSGISGGQKKKASWLNRFFLSTLVKMRPTTLERTGTSRNIHAASNYHL